MTAAATDERDDVLVTDDRADADLPSPLAAPLADRGALAWIAVGALLFVGAPTIADAVAVVLPDGAQVRGAAGMPNMGDALPGTLRWLGALMILSVCAHGLRDVGRTLLRDASAPRWWATAGALVLGVAAAAIYWGYATPHNAWEGNARVHWVEISNLRADDYFYTLVKLPHLLFYDQPGVLQSLNGAVNVLLVVAIGRSMFGTRRALPLLMGAAFLVSSSMLQFATTADEVHLSVTVLLAGHLAHLQGRHRALGVILVVATLARSQFITAAAALGVVEGVRALVDWRRQGGSPVDAVRRNPFLSRTMVVFVSLFALWHLWLTATGRGWFLAEGQLVDRDTLLSKVPIDVEGFTIHRFSGSYLFHALWIFPAPMVLAAGWAAVAQQRIPARLRTHLQYALVLIALGIVVSEVFPLAYFNERYITYYWPSLLIASFTALAIEPRADGGGASRWLPSTALALLLVGSSAATYRTADELQERIERAPGLAMWEERNELRSVVGDERVYTTIRQTTPSNYLMYVLRRPYAPIDAKGHPSGVIEVIPPGVVPPTGLVVTLHPDAFDDAEVVWSGDEVHVLRRATG